MFESLRKRLKALRSRASSEPFASHLGRRLSEERIEDLLWELEMALLEGDVALEVVDRLREAVKEALLGKRVRFGVDPGTVVEEALKEEIRRILSPEAPGFWELYESSPRPVVILFLGVNGTGKTLTVAKVAKLILDRGEIPVLSASDTFRAGAIEQLEELGRRLGLRVIKHSQGADPAAVAYDAIQHARARGRDAVLIDTAGRMQTRRNLMDEMAKIKRVAKPHITVFVGDALAGNDAVEQARAFHQHVGIDGSILTKVDADPKGGSIISVAAATGKPIFFLGTGQGLGDLVPFDPEWLLERLFG